MAKIVTYLDIYRENLKALIDEQDIPEHKYDKEANELVLKLLEASDLHERAVLLSSLRKMPEEKLNEVIEHLSIAGYSITGLKDQIQEGQCLGWKQTGGCDPEGPREEDKDQDCNQPITEWEH